MGTPLDEAQQALIVSEAQAFSERVRSPEGREAYQRLAREAGSGQVSDDRLAILGSLLEVGLGTGRIRALYDAHAEAAAAKLFRSTPQGQERAAQIRAVNEALEALRGHTLEKASITSRSAGSFSLTYQTESAKLVISLSPAGAEIRSFEVSL